MKEGVQMKPILYSSINCPHSSKTAFFLAEKGIEFQRVEVSLAEKVQKTPAYLYINPRGTVPCYEDEHGVIGDSLEIMQYIDDQENNQSLFPSDPENLEVALQWIERANTEFWDVSHHLYWQIIEPPTKGTDWEEVERLKSEGTSLLQELDLILCDQPYICGELSVADIVIVPWVYSFQRFNLPEVGQFPHLEAWRDNLTERSTFKENYNQEGIPLQVFLAKRAKE